MANYFLTMETPIGLMKLCSDEAHLKSVFFDTETSDTSSPLPEILIQTRKQLEEYFNGTRKEFDLSLDPDGTEFQRQVWKELEKVPYGVTRSYIEIARNLGSERASRAVGMANGRNPVSIIIPCHRIIGKNGKLTGYAGGMERKKWLLIHEQRSSLKSRLF